MQRRLHRHGAGRNDGGIRRRQHIVCLPCHRDDFRERAQRLKQFIAQVWRTRKNELHVRQLCSHHGGRSGDAGQDLAQFVRSTPRQ